MRLSSLIENDIAGLESGHRRLPFERYTKTTSSRSKRTRNLIKQRIEDLTALILEIATGKRVIKVQEVVQQWLDTVALRK